MSDRDYRCSWMLSSMLPTLVALVWLRANADDSMTNMEFMRAHETLMWVYAANGIMVIAACIAFDMRFGFDG